MNHKPYNIPRKSKVDHCGRCYRAFKKGDIKHDDPELRGHRFKNVGNCCCKLTLKD